MFFFKPSNKNDLGAAFQRHLAAIIAGPLIYLFVFSLVINILYLATPLYMMNIFDRVLTSLSVSTLVALTAITCFLIVSGGFLEAIRQKILNRLSVALDDSLSDKLFDGLVQVNVQKKMGATTMLEIAKVRNFLSGNALISLFDLPFTPIFLFILFLIHSALGVMGLVAIMWVTALGLLIEYRNKGTLNDSATKEQNSINYADGILRNAESLIALGMTSNMKARWRAEHQASVDSQTGVNDSFANINTLLKTSIFIIQVAMSGLACYLVVVGEATAGALFASNILAMRMISPVQQAAASWRTFVVARNSYGKIMSILERRAPRMERTKLPAPTGQITVEKLMLAPPGLKEPVLKGVSFNIEAGESLAIIGPSGSGKSCLARALVGVWKPMAGHVRFDSADVKAWNPDDLGQHLGYLAQDIELFDGTIAENITRFGDKDDVRLVDASILAGVYEVIQAQKLGFDTRIASKGGLLSGGERQRLGLARAIYGSPSIVVLDEPNSNLDAVGEGHLKKLLQELKSRKTTVVLITHNAKLASLMDKVLILRDGKVASFGPKPNAGVGEQKVVNLTPAS